MTAYPTHEAASRAHRQRPTAYLYRRGTLDAPDGYEPHDSPRPDSDLVLLAKPGHGTARDGGTQALPWWRTVGR